MVAAEAAASREAASEAVRPLIELPGALRWLRRRLLAVYAALRLLRGLMGDRFCGCAPTLSGFRPCVGTDGVLVGLRDAGAVQLKRVAQDGMRVRASAGAASFRRGATLEEHLVLPDRLGDAASDEIGACASGPRTVGRDCRG